MKRTLWTAVCVAVCALAASSWAASVSYTEDFTGADGTLPSGWTVSDGDVEIFANELSTMPDPDDSKFIAAYTAAGSEQWSNYTFSFDFMQTYEFSRLASNQSTLYAAAMFRYQDDEHSYMVRVRKLSGSSYPQVMLGAILPGGGIEWIEEVTMEPYYLDSYTWYTVTVELVDDAITITMTSRDFPEDVIATLTVTDTLYSNGSVGVYAVMSDPNYITYDNFEVTGETVTCASLQGQYGLSADLNADCYVEWADFGTFASQWQQCMDPNDANCDEPWNE